MPRLVDEAVSYCHAELDRQGVELQLRVARDLPVVKVDALQIEQVIVNLVRNAAEALTDAGRYDGRVVIEADCDGAGRVVIRVRDNGPGFDPDLAERAVTPFTTTKPDGLGLGLSLARSIVEAHGGRLSIESSSSGAVVSFTLPVACRATGSRMTIALIEDDEAALDSLRLLLEGRGMAVRGFASAEAFLASLTGSNPDCIVSDVRLPGMSGLDLQRALKARGETCPSS